MMTVKREEIARMLGRPSKDEETRGMVVRMMGGRRNFTSEQEAIEHMRATIRRLRAELAEARAAASKGKK